MQADIGVVPRLEEGNATTRFHQINRGGVAVRGDAAACGAGDCPMTLHNDIDVAAADEETAVMLTSSEKKFTKLTCTGP